MGSSNYQTQSRDRGVCKRSHSGVQEFAVQEFAVQEFAVQEFATRNVLTSPI